MMRSATHALLRPYILNAVRNISITETTEGLYAQALLTQDNTTLGKTYEVALQAKAWPIVVSLLNNKEAGQLLNRDNIERALQSKPELFKGRLDLLPYFNSAHLTAIAPIAAICEYLLQQEQGAKRITLPQLASMTFESSPETLPYRLELMARSNNTELFTGKELGQALNYNITLPPEQQPLVPREMAQKFITSRYIKLEELDAHMRALRLVPENVDTWHLTTNPLDFKYDIFTLPDASFTHVETTKKALKLMHLDVVDTLLKHVTKPLNKKLLGGMIARFSLPDFMAALLLAVDMAQVGEEILWELQTYAITISMKAVLTTQNDVLIRKVIASYSRTQTEIEELQEAMAWCMARSSAEFLPRLEEYIGLTMPHKPSVRTFMKNHASLEHHFTYLGSKPKMSHLKASLEAKLPESVEYLAGALPVTTEELVGLIDECLEEVWADGLKILAKRLPEEAREKLMGLVGG